MLAYDIVGILLFILCLVIYLKYKQVEAQCIVDTEIKDYSESRSSLDNIDTKIDKYYNSSRESLQASMTIIERKHHDILGRISEQSDVADKLVELYRDIVYRMERERLERVSKGDLQSHYVLDRQS